MVHITRIVQITPQTVLSLPNTHLHCAQMVSVQTHDIQMEDFLVAGARSGHDLPAEENSGGQMKLVAGGRLGLCLPFAAYALSPS